MAIKQNISTKSLTGRNKKTTNKTAQSAEGKVGELENTVEEQFQAMSNELIEIIS